MIPTTHQLKAAPLSFEQTFSQHFEIYVHPETDQNGRPKFDEKGQVIHRLNRRGRRYQERLQRSKRKR